MNLTIEEVRGDLAATERDSERLLAIVTNLREFIYYSHGENRRAFNTDLFKYNGLLSQAHDLRATIARKLEELTNER